MKSITRILLGMLAITVFMNCGDNGTGTDDTAYIKIMDAAGGAGSEIVLTELVPGTVETLYAVAFNESDDTFLEDVEVDKDSWAISGQIGTVVYEGHALGDDFVILTVNDLAEPSLLVSVTGDGVISLNWTASADSGVTYNVYRGVDSTLTTVYTTTTADSLDDAVTNGQKYFYAIASMVTGDLLFTPTSGEFTAKTLSAKIVSAKTNIVDDAACSQWIEVQVYVRAGTGYSLLDLSDASTYSLNGTDGTIPDVWLNNDFTFYGCENNGGILSGAWSNTTKIYSFGAADFDDATVSVAPDLTDAGWGDSGAATVGHVLGMYTEDGYYAKVRIDEVNDEAANANDYVLITLGYQSVQGYTNFKAAVK